MRKYSYLAVFEPNGSGGFGVYFPDMPGCISVGNNFKHAVKMAEEALGLHIYEMEKDNDPIPAAAENPCDLYIEPGTSAGYIVSMVTVYPDVVKNQLDNRSVRTNITLPAWLKEMAEEREINFSQLLQTSLKERLGIAE